MSFRFVGSLVATVSRPMQEPVNSHSQRPKNEGTTGVERDNFSDTAVSKQVGSLTVNLWNVFECRVSGQRAEARSPRNRDAREPDGETWQTGMTGKVKGLDRSDRYTYLKMSLHYIAFYYTTLQLHR